MQITNKNILPQCLVDFSKYMKIQENKSDKTIKAYITNSVELFQYINTQGIRQIDNNFLKKITENDLQSFITHLATKEIRPNSPRTRARKIASIRKLFIYLNNKTHIRNDNPALILDTPKFSKRDPEVLNMDEVNRLLKAVNEYGTKEEICIITLFLHLGIRLSELVDLNLDSINNVKVSIIGKGNKQRYVYLDDDCQNALNDYLEERNNMHIEKTDDSEKAIFISTHGKRVDKKTVHNLCKKFFKLAELNDELVHIHTLRHTCFTIMYRNGYSLLEIQKIAGHESLETTKLYVHLADEDVKNAMVNRNPFSKINRLQREY